MNAQLLFLQYIEAYNARNVDRMLTFIDDACVFEHISGGKVAVRTESKGELAALAAKSAAAFAWREQKVRTLTGSESRVAAEIDYRAMLQTDLTPELRAGCLLEMRGVSICEASADRIVRLADYS